jgi:hypothetical protein
MLSPPANNNLNGLQPRAREGTPRAISDVEYRSPNEVQNGKKAFVASTGVQTATRQPF